MKTCVRCSRASLPSSDPAHSHAAAAAVLALLLCQSLTQHGDECGLEVDYKGKEFIAQANIIPFGSQTATPVSSATLQRCSP